MSGISLTAVKMFVPTVPAVQVGELVPVVPTFQTFQAVKLRVVVFQFYSTALAFDNGLSRSQMQEIRALNFGVV
jgi:hypothetical protein